MNHLGPFKLLPTSRGVCQECAVNHKPHEPHNAQSMFYQYHFYSLWGRWPTWADAMLHCSEEIRRITIEVLAENGISISTEQIADAKKLSNISTKTLT